MIQQPTATDTSSKLEPEPITKSLVRNVLQNADRFEWTLQGLGMLRTYLDPHKVRRLHIWDSRYAVENVSAIHTHPWNFRSVIIAGNVRNVKYVEIDPHVAIINTNHFKQTIFCGEGGGLVGQPQRVYLHKLPEERYTARDSYFEFADEIHVSMPDDGTVTIVQRYFGSDVDHAYVYWAEGEWVSAEPRKATGKEIDDVVRASLEKWF